MSETCHCAWKICRQFVILELLFVRHMLRDDLEAFKARIADGIELFMECTRDNECKIGFVYQERHEATQMVHHLMRYNPFGDQQLVVVGPTPPLLDGTSNY